MGLYMPLPLSLLSHYTCLVILLSNPVNWPSWAAWLIAPINISHNVFGGWGWSHTPPGMFFRCFSGKVIEHSPILYKEIWEPLLNLSIQNKMLTYIWYPLLLYYSLRSLKLWSHSNSSGITHCTWLSVDRCTERKWFGVLFGAIFCNLLLRSTVASVWCKLCRINKRIKTIDLIFNNSFSLHLEADAFKEMCLFFF